MRSLTSLAVIASAAVLLSACASGPRVRTSVDQSVNFSQYKTFNFANPLGTDRNGYQSLISQQLRQSAQRELEARGLQMVSDSPQLLLNFNTRIDDKTRVTSQPVATVGMGGYYGYRYGMYSTWPMYVDQTVVTQYEQGTLNIDVVDAARKQMVWEGVVTQSVSQDDLPELGHKLDVAVKAAFAKFPVAPPPAH